MSINRVSIAGYLTRDAELRTVNGNLAVLGFTVAINEKRKDRGSGTVCGRARVRPLCSVRAAGRASCPVHDQGHEGDDRRQAALLLLHEGR